VVEPSGELVAFERMDGVAYGSIEVSQEKARTAARFMRPSKAFSDSMGARPIVLSIHSITAVEGGVPLVVDGKIIGAIGASGASSELDGQAAQAGAAALAPGGK
jgi:uncharacterized protein GlcG (DUF336 family)